MCCRGFRGCIGFLRLSGCCRGFRGCLRFLRLSVCCRGFRGCIGFLRLSVCCRGFHSKSCGCREYTSYCNLHADQMC